MWRIGHLRIRNRILITFVIISLLGGIIQSVIAGQLLRQTSLDYAESEAQSITLSAMSLLSESLDHFLEGKRADFYRTFNAIPHESIRFLVFDKNFNLIASHGSEDLPNAYTVPSTQNSQIVSTPDGDVLLTSQPVRYSNSVVAYIVLESPMQPVYTDINIRQLILAIATAFVILLVIFASLWVANTISYPVQQLSHVAQEMGQGNLSARTKNNTPDEIGQLGQTLNDMAERIERLIRNQRDFVSNSAHELRTPLMTLKLNAETLVNADISSEERHKVAQTIVDEVDHMAGLVKALLVLARIDDGRHLQSDSALATLNIWQDIERYWHIHARKANLIYHQTIGDRLPALTITRDDMRLILDNLLGNAVKYTDKGEICLDVQSEAQFLILTITDTGKGFPPDQAKQLFKRFYRTDEVRGNISGTGLGLSIVHSVVTQYGGQIYAESKGIGHGATFVVRLPQSTVP